MFLRFVTLPDCDGQTDISTTAKTALCNALRSKTGQFPVSCRRGTDDVFRRKWRTQDELPNKKQQPTRDWVDLPSCHVRHGRTRRPFCQTRESSPLSLSPGKRQIRLACLYDYRIAEWACALERLKAAAGLALRFVTSGSFSTNYSIVL